MITLSATYQQTKRVVDPVAGTYQTVLTIDSSLDKDSIGSECHCGDIQLHSGE